MEHWVKNFGLLWLSEFTGVVAVRYAGFSYAIWVFEKTQSSTAYALMIFCEIVPLVLALPFAGIVVDHFNRKYCMLVSCVCQLLIFSILYFIFVDQESTLTLLFILIATLSLFNSIYGPASSASVVILVPPERLDKANAILQGSYGIQETFIPISAGFFYLTFGIDGALEFALCMTMISVGAMCLVKIPNIHEKSESVWSLLKTILTQLNTGIQYVRQKSGLFSLFTFTMLINICSGGIQVTIVTYVLKFYGAFELGMLSSALGLGMVVGSILAFHINFSRRVALMLFGEILNLLIILTTLLFFKIYVLIGMAFVLAIFIPIVFVASQTLLQKKVDTQMQGRVFSIRYFFMIVGFPIGVMLSGPLLDYIFIPCSENIMSYLSTTGDIFYWDASVLPSVLCCLMFAFFMLAIIIWARLNPALWCLESQLPDISADLQIKSSED